MTYNTKHNGSGASNTGYTDAVRKILPYWLKYMKQQEIHILLS